MNQLAIVTGIVAVIFFGACQSPSALPEHPPVNHDSVHIAYNLAGHGDTAVLLVHGWCINKEYWQPQMAALARRYKVVAPDLGGHGESGHNRNSWTIHDFAGDIEAVIRTLQLKKVILVGHSMGGDIILDVANDMPDRVIGFVGIDNFKEVTDSIPTADQTSIDNFLASLKQHYSSVAAAYSTASLFPPHYHDSASVARVIGDIRNADSAMAIASIESVIRFREPEPLSKLRLPVYLIVSDYTPLNQEGLKKYCHHGYYVKTIYGTGHYPMIEKPAEFNRLLLETLQEISTGPAQ